MKKRLISLMTVCALMLCSVPCFAQTTFVDVDNILSSIAINNDYINSIIAKCLSGINLNINNMLPELNIWDTDSFISNSQKNYKSELPSLPQVNVIQESQTDKGAIPNSDIAGQILELVNRERMANGISTLSLDSTLTRMADYKAQDMASYGFSHEGSYGDLGNLLQKFGVMYSAAGENIAMNQQSAAEVMDAWMHSEGHRANILNGSFRKLGVGYYESGGNIYWVQEFTD